TIATVHGGVRGNIIPDSLEMQGTIRTHDEAVRADIWKRIEKTASAIAETQGAKAIVTVYQGVPVTYNDPPLTAWGTKSLGRGVGEERIRESRPVMGAEDFSILAQKGPAMFFFLRLTPPHHDPQHTPAPP